MIFIPKKYFSHFWGVGGGQLPPSPVCYTPMFAYDGFKGLHREWLLVALQYR